MNTTESTKDIIHIGKIQDIIHIGKIHHVLVTALAEYAEKEESNDDNIAAHNFAAVITLAYQINKDFAKGKLSDAVAMAEPIAILIDTMRSHFEKPEQAPAEQAVS